jgi:hypothetical protein
MADDSDKLSGVEEYIAATIALTEKLAPDQEKSLRDALEKLSTLLSWSLLAAGYSYSGAMKLISPSWIDGSALFHILHNPLARPGVGRELLLQLPASWLQLATWVRSPRR